jgi:hypothetical protein
MSSIRTLVLVAIAAAAWSARAQDDAGARWPIAGVPAPTTEIALELRVSLGPAVSVGQSDSGTRQFIPITGGRFKGDGIQGEVLAGGADWQLVRPDGVVEVHALYSLRTDDGAVIVVDNNGIIVPPPAPASAGAPAPAAYVRTSPQFHAPKGKYDWLNKTVFVGSITPARDGGSAASAGADSRPPAPGGGAVIIRAFRVR